jgi:TolB-like protein
VKYAKITFFLGLVLLASAVPAFSQNLDAAVAAGLDALLKRIPEGSAVAVMGFNAPTKKASDYIAEDVIALIAENGRVRNVERDKLDLVRRELDFQMSGDVSDETMQSIGNMTGAEYLITGSFTPINRDYRLIMQAVRLETAENLGAARIMVNEDKVIRDILGIQGLTPLAAGFANLALGLGSYVSGDIAGGLIITAGYAASAGMVLYDMLALVYEDKLAGILAPIGLGTAALTAAFGFVRPYFYQKSGKTAQAGDPAGFAIALSPGEESPRLLLMYRWKF